MSTNNSNNENNKEVIVRKADREIEFDENLGKYKSVEVKPSSLSSGKKKTSSDSLNGEKEPKKRWYVVHVYSGHENKVKATIEKAVKTSSPAYWAEYKNYKHLSLCVRGLSSANIKLTATAQNSHW